MLQCPLCKNTLFDSHGQCVYCVWKGDAGPGLRLKHVLGTTQRRKVNIQSVSKKYEEWCDANRPSTQEQRKAAYAQIHETVLRYERTLP